MTGSLRRDNWGGREACEVKAGRWVVEVNIYVRIFTVELGLTSPIPQRIINIPEGEFNSTQFQHRAVH